MIRLVCMRLDEMLRVHPHQINKVCCKCGATVGVYPSGQRVLKDNPGNVEIVCNHCQTPVGSQLAPGAIMEVFESQPANNQSSALSNDCDQEEGA